MLSLLKARDAQIDNVNLRYVESTEQRVPSEVLREMPAEVRQQILDRGGIVKHQHLKQLTIRGTATTFTSQPDPDAALDNPAGLGFAQLERESNKKGARWSYTEAQDGYRDMTIEAASPRDDVLLRTRTRIEFSLGIGFGASMSEIASIRRVGGDYKVAGTITPYQMAPGVCDLSIDSNWIVRSARITSVIDDDQIVIAVETHGTRTSGGFVFPETSEFVMTHVDLREDPAGLRPRVLEQSTVKFVDCAWRLADAEYDRLTYLEIEPGMRVSDRVAGHHYTAGGNAGEMKDIIEHGIGGSAPFNVKGAIGVAPDTRAENTIPANDTGDLMEGLGNWFGARILGGAVLVTTLGAALWIGRRKRGDRLGSR